MRGYMLLLLLLRERLLQSGALPAVMLPVEQLLLVDELGALRVHQLLPEVLVLQQLQHVQAVRVLEELGVLGLLPVQQVLQVVDEGPLPQEASLSQEVEVVGVGQTLDELQLRLETVPRLLLCLHDDGCRQIRFQKRLTVGK